MGVWLALAAVAMLFVGFTSAYLVRRQAPDWGGGLPVPPLLWVNTAVLALSSAVLEAGRRRFASGAQGAGRALALAAATGLAFVAGQLRVWQELSAAGVYLASNPHSSFFYVLTGAHGLHVLVGVAWLLYAAVRVARAGWAAPAPAGAGAQDLAAMVSACATFWHFMAGLWAFLFVLLFAV
mgnify:FL=1